MNYLKLDGIVGLKACRVIIYKIFDVIKMYHHWKLPVPQYLTDLSTGIVRRMHSPTTLVVTAFMQPV